MEKERIEYLRKNDGVSVKLLDDDGNVIGHTRHSKGKKRGVLFCGIDPQDEQKVVVGFTLCNNKDEFDYPGGKRNPGFGLWLTKLRAEKWKNHSSCFIQRTFTEAELIDGNCLYIENTDPKNVVEIPPSIVKKFEKFINRCKRYYKDKKFPLWVDRLHD